MMQTVRVWDLPTRLFHWLLAAAVLGLLITANIGGNWMVWHLRLGFAVLALLLFRVVWGFVGGHWSRFGTFLFAPSAVTAYLRGQARPEHRVGHSPLGALSVMALLAVLLAQVGTGLMSDDEIAFFGPLVRFVSSDTVAMATSYHTDVGKFIVLGLVVLHVAAILFYKWVKKDNLITPMVLGDKEIDASLKVAQSRDSRATLGLALLVVSVCAGAVVWLAQLGNAF